MSISLAEGVLSSREALANRCSSGVFSAVISWNHADSTLFISRTVLSHASSRWSIPGLRNWINDRRLSVVALRTDSFGRHLESRGRDEG